MAKCIACGTFMAADADHCVQCGGKQASQLGISGYGIFFILAAVVALVLGAGVYGWIGLGVGVALMVLDQYFYQIMGAAILLAIATTLILLIPES